MKILKVTEDMHLTEHEWPEGETIEMQNDFLHKLIDEDKCELFEHVMPIRLYEELGHSNRPTVIHPGRCVSMLIDEEGLYNDYDANPVGSYLYETDINGNPIMGPVIFVGERMTDDGPCFCGIDDKVFDTLKHQIKHLIDTSNPEYMKIWQLSVKKRMEGFK